MRLFERPGPVNTSEVIEIAKNVSSLERSTIYRAVGQAGDFFRTGRQHRVSTINGSTRRSDKAAQRL